MNLKLEEDQIFLQESYTVYIVSFDIFKEWPDNGLMQSPEDVYEYEDFKNNNEQRFMMKIEKNYKIIDLLTKLRKKRISPPADLNLYRVRYDKNS